jgi:Hemerythrin HHE cation binding domain
LRKTMVEQLVIEESKHEALEEMYFWPAVRDKIADGGQLADTAIEQEQHGREVLNQLDKLNPGQLRFEQLLINFIVAGREHIRFEEGQVWPRLRRRAQRRRGAQTRRPDRRLAEHRPDQATRTPRPRRAG